MATTKKIKTQPVGKENWMDLEALFESRGGPSYCWCMVWRMNSQELKNNNSKARKKFMKKRVWSETPIGLLAYVADEPVGWCSVGPRDTYRRLGGDERLENVWSIVCFFIRKEFRGNGFVDQFIQHAKKYARKNGGKYIEAYAVKSDSPSYRFMGFIDRFEKAGFEFVKMAGTRRHVMTCKL